MFSSAKAFNQNLASWNVLRVTTLSSAFDSASALSSCNKGAIYRLWGATLRAAYPAWSGESSACLVDGNVGTAATAWATSPTTAAATYGNIADRDVATVNPTATTLEGVMRRPLELTVGLVAVSLALIAAVTCHERKLRRITHGGAALGCLVLLLFPAGGSGQTSSLVLSTNKPAAQSSVSNYGSASKAVDGDTNSQFSAGSCTHTNGNGESSPWWTVDLGASYAIEKVRFRSEPRA